MEKFFRVDFRLLHGQVGMTWIPYLGADCLLIANDHIMDNIYKNGKTKRCKARD